jgi:tetratricopeptide (TPR) repeat protein
MELNDFSKSENYFKATLEIRSRFAKNNPEKFNPDLAMVLDNMGMLYYKFYHMKDALAFYSKGLAMYQELASKNPHEYNKNLVGNLILIGRIHGYNRNLPEAKSVFLKAIEICKESMSSNPQIFNRQLKIAQATLERVLLDEKK